MCNNGGRQGGGERRTDATTETNEARGGGESSGMQFIKNDAATTAIYTHSLNDTLPF